MKDLIEMRAMLPMGGVMVAGVMVFMMLTGCQQRPAAPQGTTGTGHENASAEDAVSLSSSPETAVQSSEGSASSTSVEATPKDGQRAGLWKLTQTLPQMDSTWVSHICIDASQGARLAMVGQDLLGKPEMAHLSCTRAGVVSKNGGVEAETVCKVNDTTLSSHIHADIVGDDVFHQTVETRYSPAFAGHGDQITVTDAAWQGACPPGMQAGDFVNRDGVHSNVSAVLAKFR